MTMILTVLGLHNLPPMVFWVVIILAFTVSIGFGWGADEILGDLSFGIIINSILLLTGGIISYLVWKYFNMPIKDEYAYYFTAVTGLGATLFLLFCGYLRRFG
jgi:hypothetical protein